MSVQHPVASAMPAACRHASNSALELEDPPPQLFPLRLMFLFLLFVQMACVLEKVWY